MLTLSPTRTIIRGDSDIFKVTFVKQTEKLPDDCYCGRHPNTKCQENITEIPIDITGWKIRFTVRPEVPPTESEVGDEDALIAEEAVILDAEAGIAQFSIPSKKTTKIDPGQYLYDIQVIKPMNEFGIQAVNSIRRGKYIVIGDITREERYNPEESELGEEVDPVNPLDPPECDTNPPYEDELVEENEPTLLDSVDDADDGYNIG